MEAYKHSSKNGSIVSTKKQLKVAAKNGFIIIEKIKLPGKKMMDVKSLLNGYTFKDGPTML